MAKQANIDSLMQPGALALPEFETAFLQIIRDAMKLTAMLGQRLLWVDTLCIIQDDAGHKLKQLQSMHMIYSRAFLTIAALAGSNAEFGLPGVLPGTRTRLTTPLSGEGGLVASAADFETAIQSSTHSTHGWTLQETLLPRRCLYITEEQCFFRCNRSLCSDGWDKVPDPSFELDTALQLHYAPGPVDGAFFSYRFLVEMYSRRNLSFDADILNAITGIMAARRRFYPQEENTERRESPRGGESPPHFPLWSWIGWKAPVSYAIYRLWSPTDASAVVESRRRALVWSYEVKAAHSGAFEAIRAPPPTHIKCATRCGLCLEPPGTGSCLPDNTPCPPEYDPLHLLRLRVFTASASGLRLGNREVETAPSVHHQAKLDVVALCDENGGRRGVLLNPPLGNFPGGFLDGYSMIGLAVFKSTMNVPGHLFGAEGTDWHNLGCQCLVSFMLVEEVGGVVLRAAVGLLMAQQWSMMYPELRVVTIA
ncbi:hypothetical protein B0T25DRAFT_628194 [Lasiosphaeria hispida]|uniref:Heterokaryon incompatibility domain-containing protein n=1 Tax=Lasiosphaeria hispida TaxID=260671 RepID=A0AAJ0HXM0_9PEZI|nr:hypothetical protein B0T25DRAFT_628194 [Lasiosphaeria hispida]